MKLILIAGVAGLILVLAAVALFFLLILRTGDQD